MTTRHLTGMRMRGALLQLMTLGVVVTAHPVFADVWQPLEQWRIAEGRLAPWAQAGTRIDPVYRGREVRFQTTRIVAPQPIACEGATYEWRFVEAEGLFEGNLPAPATAAAQRLGLGPAPIATLRAACANASFDFHRTSRGELLLGLDNVVWTLRPARAASTPTEVLQELLITHFTHDMAFTRESVARKNAFLSADLRARIGRYLAAPQSPDQAPDIDGDPFTDSQEYPDRFTLGQARAAAQRTTVPVNFADAHSKRRVDYVLVSEAGRWVVDDLVDERGQSIRRLLGTAQTPTQAVARTETFAEFFTRFRVALASGRAADVAALTHTPFLYEGKQLDTAGFTRIVPTLFTAAVKRCIATATPIPEDDRQVVFCKPYAFYFGRDAAGKGGIRLLEFAADGEDAR